MKKYYLHNGTESSGPFDIEELKAKNINKTSPVWFEGMMHWKTAGEIPELNHLFTINPPNFPPFESNTTTRKPEIKKEARKILGLSKNLFLVTCVAIVALIGICILNSIEEKRSRELSIKNHKTEVENYQLELKQKELDEQKIQAVIQEKIDAERKASALTQNANNRLLEIEKLLSSYQNNIAETEIKLEEAASNKFLKTAAEKKEQMELLQKNIDSFRTAIDLLTNESEKLKLDVEKTPN